MMWLRSGSKGREVLKYVGVKRLLRGWDSPQWVPRWKAIGAHGAGLVSNITLGPSSLPSC